MIRIEILIILNLIWINMIDILVIKIEIFHNMIWSSRIEWLQSIFSDLFILILIMIKVDFSSEVWINWSQFWHSCCASNDHQKLLWSWQSQLIISRCWILKCRILLLSFVFSIAVVFLQRSFTLWEICWHKIKLRIRSMYEWLIIKALIELDYHEQHDMTSDVDDHHDSSSLDWEIDSWSFWNHKKNKIVWK